MFSRDERLRELFRVEIAKALREVKDPGIAGLVTLTDIKLSSDRKTVTVFYSVLGSAQERGRTARALSRSAPFLHYLLVKRLSLRIVPRLVFEFDETPHRAARVDKLLGRIERERER